MAKKKNDSWILIIVIIIGILFLNNYQNKQPDSMGFKVHYYKNNIEVFPQNTFSIVTPPGGNFDAISLEIQGTNTGSYDFTEMKIADATPSAFKAALPTTTNTLLAGQTKSLWTSSLMATSQFESFSQPVRFWVDISGKNAYNGNTIHQTGYIDLAITSQSNIQSGYNTAADKGTITFPKPFTSTPIVIVSGKGIWSTHGVTPYLVSNEGVTLSADYSNPEVYWIAIGSY